MENIKVSEIYYIHKNTIQFAESSVPSSSVEKVKQALLADENFIEIEGIWVILCYAEYDSINGELKIGNRVIPLCKYSDSAEKVTTFMKRISLDKNLVLRF